MTDIENTVLNAIRECNTLKKKGQYEFQPEIAYTNCCYTLPSVARYFGTDEYQKAIQTKILRAYLGMKDAEKYAQDMQLSKVQKQINRLFG